MDGPFGARLYGDALDGTFHMIVRNAYGNFTYDSLRQADQACVFLDIGANIGLYSVALGSHFSGPRLAFEPNPETFAYLQANLAQAGLTEVIALCAGVAGEDVASATLNLRRFHSGAASLVSDFGHTRSRITLLGPTMMRALVPATFPIVCKIDVEGAETGVVSCLAQSGLLERCERMVIEMSLGTNSEIDLKTIRETLNTAGLVLRDRSGSDHFGDELYTR
ncbi:FkbM family methyltransferase [Roseovarius sp.]|uniref:FkbM family methyltransferase n=1 Tax=Roseovarius sp. TaxID=1486281 RepID=UPI003562593C